MLSGRDSLKLATLDSVPLLGPAIVVESRSTTPEDSLIIAVTTDLLAVNSEGPVADSGALQVEVASHTAITAVNLRDMAYL